MEDLGDEYRRLESYVKTLLNNQLKEILKREGLAVTGVKAVLQSRIMERLHDFLVSGDAAGFREFRQKIKPHAASATANGYKPYHADQYRTMPSGSRPIPQGGYSTAGSITFTHSPFFKVLQPLTKIETLPVMKTNRHTVAFEIRLSDAQVQRLKSSNVAIMLYCAAEASYTHANHISFPPQIEVKINGDQLQANLRGLKKKSGTTRPADLTSMIRKLPGYPNMVSITYAATDSVSDPKPKECLDVPHQVLAQLVQTYSVEELSKVIERGHVISHDTVLQEMLSRANDDDIVLTSTVMSLKCPLSFMRIQLPCRFSICNHNQCFDATSFLQTNEQAPQWECPICRKVSTFENLVIDEYFRGILKKTTSDIESVVVEPAGAWRVANRDDERNKPSNGTKASKVASKVEDDDDLVEIIDRPDINGIKSEALTPTSTLAPVHIKEAPSSGKRSSQKRKHDEVIDLTLDSDDDAPMPPLKRSTTSVTAVSGTNLPMHQSPYASSGASGYPSPLVLPNMTRPAPPTPSFGSTTEFIPPTGSSQLSPNMPSTYTGFNLPPLGQAARDNRYGYGGSPPAQNSNAQYSNFRSWT